MIITIVSTDSRQCDALVVVILSEATASRKCPIFTTSSDIHGRWLGETGQRMNIIYNLDRDLCKCSDVWERYLQQ